MHMARLWPPIWSLWRHWATHSYDALRVSFIFAFDTIWLTMILLLLNRRSDEDASKDHEEEFYYTEIECDTDDENVPHFPTCNKMVVAPATSPFESISSCSRSPPPASPGPFTASAPTWSHLDMVRPPTEDPEYKRALIAKSMPINIPGTIASHFMSGCAQSPLNLSSPKANKLIRLNNNSNNSKSHCTGSGSVGNGGTTPIAVARSLLMSPTEVKPGRSGRSRGEARKCRKVYGMDARDAWCTQCKWKKACTRFSV